MTSLVHSITRFFSFQYARCLTIGYSHSNALQLCVSRLYSNDRATARNRISGKHPKRNKVSKFKDVDRGFITVAGDLPAGSKL